jgi:hypothetical protein
LNLVWKAKGFDLTVNCRDELAILKMAGFSARFHVEYVGNITEVANITKKEK